MTRPISPPRQITGRSVLIGFLAFFGVIFAVNGALVYFALSSWPGLVVGHAYKSGLDYNQTLAAAERQRNLGWRSQINLGDDQRLSVRIYDKSATLISGLSPTARLLRPTHVGEDRNLIFSETENGVYSTAVAGLAPGPWRVELKVSDGDVLRFFIIHELRVE